MFICNKNYQKSWRLSENLKNVFWYIQISVFYCWKNVFTLIYRWLWKTWQKYFWQSPKYESHYWCWLRTRKNGVCKDFGLRNVGDYYDLHVQGNTLLLVDVFENFVLKYMSLIRSISFWTRISMVSSLKKD